LADLSTPEGQEFAARYNSGQTTLIFFDRLGAFLYQRYGVLTEPQLRTLIDATYGFGNPSGDSSRRQADLEKIRKQYDDTAKRIIESIGR
jgi:hypothetical protein